jgi:hypothetical protein
MRGLQSRLRRFDSGRRLGLWQAVSALITPRTSRIPPPRPEPRTFAGLRTQISRPRSPPRARCGGPSRAAPALPAVLQDLIGSPGENAGRSPQHGLGVVEVDAPAPGVGEFGELLAIHDRVGPPRTARDAGRRVSGEVKRPGSKRDRADAAGRRAGVLVERGRRRPDHGCSHRRHRRGRRDGPAEVVGDAHAHVADYPVHVRRR